MSDQPNMRIPEQLAARLRARILGGKHRPGEKMPSARKLAVEFGVSVSTLRAAEAILMHEGRLAGHPRSGVRVCPAGACFRVGVLSELNLLSTDCCYHRDLANHTLRLLRACGMAATLYCGSLRPGESSDAPTCPEFWDALEHGRLDAVVVIDAPATEAWYWSMQNLPVPAVGTFTSFPMEDNALCMIVPGLRALRAHGASRIAMLTWERGRAFPVFEQALAALGLVSGPSWIGGEFNPALPGSGWEAFRDIWTAEPEKPDGLLVTDDVLFRDAALAIAELGIDVPGELKVATLANSSLSLPAVAIPHTRFEFDPMTDAQALVDLLERRLAGEAPPAEPVRRPFAVVEVGASAAVQSTRKHANTAGFDDREATGKRFATIPYEG